MRDLKSGRTLSSWNRYSSSASASRLDFGLPNTSQWPHFKVSPLYTDFSNNPNQLPTHQQPQGGGPRLGSESQGQVPPPFRLGFDTQGQDFSPSRLGFQIQCLCKEGDLNKALDALSLMDQHGFAPPENLYWSLLKACNKQKALIQAKQVHCHLARHGLGFSSSLADYMVSILAKCGGLEDALHVFYLLPYRTVFSWTAVISAFTECGEGRRALETYRHMQEEGVEPNEYTFVSLLKACGSIPDLKEGKALHADALTKGLDLHVFVGSTLVSMYGKCGNILEAEKVFHGLSKRNVVSWNAMLSAYAEQGEGEKALWLYEQLKEEGIDPNERTYVNLLQACCMLGEKEGAVIVDGQLTKLKSLETGKILHADIQCKGLESNVFVGNSLVSMFGKCGSIVGAENVFLGISECTVISWTAMLSAYIEQGEAERAIQLYRKMQETHVSPNERTFAIVFQACCMLAEKEDFLVVEGQKTKLLSLEIGRALHVDARRKGLDLDTCVGSTLVNMYGKCGSILEAESVFGGLSQRDIVAWNAMLSAYVEQDEGDITLHLYRVMQGEGVSPDERTSVIALQACGVLAVKEEAIVVEGQSTKVMSLEIGQALHADAQRRGFNSDVFVGSTLVSMYGKCGSILDAESVFGVLCHRDVVSWTAMLSAYGEQGQVQKALQLYRQMQEEGVILDDATLVCVVQACSETGTLEICRQIHFDILSTRFEPTSLLLTTAFIHAYGSCASMVDAQAAFDVLPEPDVVSWSALITGYAREGNFAASFQSYEGMKRACIKPNEVTFLSLLSACGHAGLVNKGVEFFESMSVDYALTPKIEHFVTIVDLLGRVGDLGRAEDMLSRMPVEPDLAMWLCLLGACRKHGNVKLGKRVFDRAVHLQPNKAAAYVMMSNIFTDAGLWDCASEVDSFRHKEGAWKKPGQSWIEHDQEVHSFVVGDRKHPQQEHLYKLLRQLSVKLKKEGQVPHTDHILSGVAEEWFMCG